jgi:hypothetical protein
MISENGRTEEELDLMVGPNGKWMDQMTRNPQVPAHMEHTEECAPCVVKEMCTKQLLSAADDEAADATAAAPPPDIACSAELPFLARVYLVQFEYCKGDCDRTGALIAVMLLAPTMVAILVAVSKLQTF